MQTLDEVVLETIQSFVRDNVLFTALDVSNQVKSVLPHARHREVRDLVRSMFSTDVEPAGWARTPITVTLGDGNTAEALLYHPLSASWDLDAEYDAQKRSQSSARATTPVVPATVAADGTVTVSPAPAPVLASTPTVPVTSSKPARDLWNQLFRTQPSLFPRK